MRVPTFVCATAFLVVCWGYLQALTSKCRLQIHHSGLEREFIPEENVFNLQYESGTGFHIESGKLGLGLA